MAEDAEREIQRIKAETDYYKILRLERSTCSDVDIKKSYRKLALLLHPDKCEKVGTEEAFKKVSAAYACLSETSSRRQYDVSGTDGGGAGNFGGNDVDINEILRKFMDQQGGFEEFGGLGGRGRGRGRPFVFHTFHAPGGGGSPFFNVGTSGGSGGRTSWTMMLSLLFFVLYMAYLFFSTLLYHYKRILWIVLILFCSRSVPVELRANLRNFAIAIALLAPKEYLLFP
jgi:DnaJ family protein B protein 12